MKWLKWVFVVAVLIFLGVLAFDLYPGLRGGAGWDWTYVPPQDWTAVILLAVALIAYVSGALLLRGRAVWLVLTWTVIAGTVLSYAVVNVSPQGDAFFHLFTRTLSPVQTGASTISVRYMAPDAGENAFGVTNIEPSGVEDTLKNWLDVMHEAQDLNLIHFTTSPPGQPLIHRAVADVLDAPALSGISQPLSMSLRPYQCSDYQVMYYTAGEIASAGLIGYLMPLLAALTALPIFSVARLLLDDRQKAVQIAQWWALVPAFLMFAPTWNTLYPLLVTTSFALLISALKTRRLVWRGLLAGLLMSFTTFLNFSVLPALLLFGLVTLGYWWFVQRHEDDAPSFAFPVLMGVWFGIGLSSIWIVYWLYSGYSPFDIWAETFGAHSALVQRDYLPWVILHPYDVFLFTGFPAVIFALWGLIVTIRTGERSLFAVFSVSMALMILAVNFAGIVQGENARILLFYMPFILLMGAGIITQSRYADAPLFGVQALTVLIMASVLLVVPLDLNPQITAPRSDIGGLGDVVWTESPTPDAIYTSDVYDGGFRFNRYRHVGDPSQQVITFEFEWTGVQPTERPYLFELNARADSSIGEIVAEPFLWQAQNGSYLPTCWREGDIINDVQVMPLPPVPEPVVWDVTLRAVDERTGDVIMGYKLLPIQYP